MMMGATTHNTSPGLAAPPAGYADWLTELTTRIHSAQQRATLAVNRELVLLYWQIGQDNMRAFAEAWPDAEFVQQAAAPLPWGHNLVLLDKLPGPQTRRWYAAKAIENNWSRNILTMHKAP